ncbi:MAG TPA: homoserine kinase [candidate division Zixibacteria bacterium]|nr:homoserine kinase [candidate division Zixibacteria bacterium]
MAIYTPLTKKEAAWIADEFLLGDLTSYTGIRNGSVNTHYLLETKRGRFFVKIDEVKGELEVKQELDLLFYLKKQGFPCLQPIKTKTGRFYVEIQGKIVTVSRYLEGVELPNESLTPAHLSLMGNALANLHLIGRGYKKGIENRFGFNRILAIYREARRQLPAHLKNIVRVLDDEFSYLENYLDNNLPKGIIHGDLFPDNVKFKGNRLTGVLDFEAACRGKLIYDLATAVNALCFLDGRYRIERFEPLIAGYETLRPLSLPEWDSFPNELRFSALRFTVTRIKDFYLRKADDSQRIYKDFKEFYDRLLILRREKSGGMEDILLAMATGYDYRKYQKSKPSK